MKVNEIRDLAPEELLTRISDTRKELVDLRFQLAARKLESTSKLREARKMLSRLLTIQTQKGGNDDIHKADISSTPKKKAAPKKAAEKAPKAAAAKKPAAKKEKATAEA
jgi:large subunit ribosomal protein L29